MHMYLTPASYLRPGRVSPAGVAYNAERIAFSVQFARRPHKRPQSSFRMSSAKDEVWALDFDGVVCDSVGESSESSWKASIRLWPDLFGKEETKSRHAEIMAKMRAVRPVVETGYENLVQIRCLLANMTVQHILENWHDVLSDSMQQWNLNRIELVDLFGSTRDEWIASDLEGWLGLNSIYPSMPETLHTLLDRAETYIVTTKQERFTEALLRNTAKVPFPSERIYSMTVSGEPKSGVLLMLQHRHPNCTYHFIEDKMSTLEKVCAIPELSHWQLYLADWGYNTATERHRAAQNQRIKVVSLNEFAALAAGEALASI